MKTVYKKRIAKEFLYFLGVVLLLLSLWGIIGLWNLYWKQFKKYETEKIGKQIENNKLKVEYLSDDIKNLEKKKHRRNDFYVKIVCLPYLTELIFAKKQSDIDSLINLLNDLKISKQKQKEKEKEEYNKRMEEYGMLEKFFYKVRKKYGKKLDFGKGTFIHKGIIIPFRVTFLNESEKRELDGIIIRYQVELKRRTAEEAFLAEVFNPFSLTKEDWRVHYRTADYLLQCHGDTLSGTDIFGRSKKKTKHYFQEFWGEIKEKKKIFFYHLDSETKYLLGIDSLKNLDYLFITKKKILDEKEMLRLQKEESRLLSKRTNMYDQYKRNHLNLKNILLTCGIILFSLLYPLRIFIISVLWSVKTLRDRS